MTEILEPIASTILVAYFIALVLRGPRRRTDRLALIVSRRGPERLLRALNLQILMLRVGSVIMTAVGVAVWTLWSRVDGSVVWDEVARGYTLVALGLCFWLASTYVMKFKSLVKDSLRGWEGKAIATDAK